MPLGDGIKEPKIGRKLPGGVTSASKEWESRHGYKPDGKATVELYNLKADLRRKAMSPPSIRSASWNSRRC